MKVIEVFAEGIKRGMASVPIDGKIYVAKGDAYGPYSNTIYDQNLDYISYPDSLGSACGYCSNCFSLQGHGLSEMGLPNMPNYNLGCELNYRQCYNKTQYTTLLNHLQLFISVLKHNFHFPHPKE